MQELGALFTSGLLSSTLLPGNSEAIFLFYLQSSTQEPLLLLIAVSLGNLIGSYLNYAIGRGILAGSRFTTSKDKKQLFRRRNLIRKIRSHEGWSLFFCFLPVVGDPMTLIAGLVRVKWWKFLLIVGLGKTSRYIFIWQINDFL